MNNYGLANHIHDAGNASQLADLNTSECAIGSSGGLHSFGQAGNHAVSRGCFDNIPSHANRHIDDGSYYDSDVSPQYPFSTAFQYGSPYASGPYPVPVSGTGMNTNAGSDINLCPNQKASLWSPLTPNSNRRRRQSTVPGNGSPRSTCSKCGKTFGRPSDLERHAKLHQADAPVFHCMAVGCGYSSKRSDKLAEHVRRIHYE